MQTGVVSPSFLAGVMLCGLGSAFLNISSSPVIEVQDVRFPIGRGTMVEDLRHGGTADGLVENPCEDSSLLC